MATITISAPEAKSDVVFEAPNNLLDLNIPDVQAKIKDRALAVAVHLDADTQCGRDGDGFNCHEILQKLAAIAAGVQACLAQKTRSTLALPSVRLPSSRAP